MSTSKIQVQFHIYFSSGVLSNGKSPFVPQNLLYLYVHELVWYLYYDKKKYVIHVWHNAAVLVMPLNTTNF